MKQTADNAVACRIPCVLCGADSGYQALASWVSVEMVSQSGMLRENPSALHILTDSGFVGPKAEAVACARDLMVVRLTRDAQEIKRTDLGNIIACGCVDAVTVVVVSSSASFGPITVLQSR